MDEPFLPWWLMLLLAMWATAFAVWRQPAFHREVRLWAGLLTLVYVALIFLALGFGAHRPSAGPSPLANVRLLDLGLAICIVTSLAASVWIFGGIAVRGRQVCYVILTLANAAYCVLQAPGNWGLLPAGRRRLLFAWPTPSRLVARVIPFATKLDRERCNGPRPNVVHRETSARFGWSPV